MIGFIKSPSETDLRGAFDFSAPLKVLTINGFKDLKTIHQETFRRLVNLESIDLKNCAIDKIEPGAFKTLKIVKFCDLSNNSLTKCPLIEGMNNLERLSLSYNRIDSTDGVFSKPSLTEKTKLVMLDLRRNRFESLSADCFSSLVALRSIDLSWNLYLNDISSQAFTHLVLLRELDLSFTALKALKSGTFSTLPGLKKLFLFSVDVESVETSAFAHIRHKLSISTYSGDSSSSLFTKFEPRELIDIVNVERVNELNRLEDREL